MIKNGMRLVNQQGTEVNVGDKLTDFRGDEWVVTGGQPPHHSGSSGRIYVEREGSQREFFPTVFDCVWKELDS
jgi:hypothetical protein